MNYREMLVRLLVREVCEHIHENLAANYAEGSCVLPNRANVLGKFSEELAEELGEELHTAAWEFVLQLAEPETK